MERIAYSSWGTALQNKTIKLALDIQHLAELTHEEKHTNTQEPQSHTRMPALGPVSGEMHPELQGGGNQHRSNTR